MDVPIRFIENKISTRIAVVGIGGAGGNAINNIIESDLKNVDFIVLNTDAQDLEQNKSPEKILLGMNLTNGRGAGGDPEIGRRAALESIDQVKEALEGSDMVFISAGMGGGTGTGGAPVIAQLCKEWGALVVAIVSKPFSFEGRVRLRQAERGIIQLQKVADVIITIPNDHLLKMAPRDASPLEMFKRADEILYYTVKGIAGFITRPGLVNRDFSDVRNIMSKKGLAFIGAGVAKGENRAIEAAHKAIHNPLLEDVSVSVKGATGMLINITSSSMTMEETYEASTLIKKEADEDANIIWGMVFDDSMGDEMMITVIATGIGDKMPRDTKTITQRNGQRTIFRLPKQEELDIPAFISRKAD